MDADDPIQVRYYRIHTHIRVIFLHAKAYVTNALVLLLSILTIMLFEWFDHYSVVGDQLLTNPSFKAGVAGWQLSRGVPTDQVDQLILTNEFEGQSKTVVQTIPRPGRYLRMRANLDIKDVRQGPEVWHKARIDLLGRDLGGKWRWDFDNTLISSLGTQSFRNVDKVVDIPAEFDPIRVEIELTGAVGTMRVADVRVWPVEVRSASQLARHILKYLWLALVLLILAVLAVNRHYLALVGMLIVGFLLIFIPEEWKVVCRQEPK